jgi:serine/threonine protein kinase
LVPGILEKMPKGVRYRVVNKIAHGGMAEIFLALQGGAEGFQKPVVLKRILPTLAADPTFVRMLVDEAHIASSLNHSNLVQVLDLGKAGDQYFLVLEFVDGWSLEQVRRRAAKARLKLPLPLALYVVSALCRALAYVHTRSRDGRPLGIVHRDVTPQNVLLSREGEVKLADFGIAKAVGRREKSVTGVIKGKFAYMSPEQANGDELDARSDLFSVGTLLYILTTGKKPFEGATDLDILMLVRKARFEKPSLIVKDFNPEVERFIMRAMRGDLARRWQSAEQMADKLDGILVKLGQPSGPAAVKRWLESLAAKDGVKPPAETNEPPPRDLTIELGSGDLELQDVAPPPESPDEALERRPPPRPAARAGTGKSTRNTQLPTPAPARDEARTRLEPPALPAVTFDPAPPTAMARFGRWLRRLILRTVLAAVLLGGILGVSAYYARPYLPAWVVQPVEAWLRQLPPPLGEGEKASVKPPAPRR